jgi:hypothetical protein
MFEPLIIALVFPLISSPAWQLPSTPKMFKLGWQLYRAWEGEKMDQGDLLREFLLEYEWLHTMPPDVVRHFKSKCPVSRQESGGGRNRKRNHPPTSATDAGGVRKQASFPRQLSNGKRW